MKRLFLTVMTVGFLLFSLTVRGQAVQLKLTLEQAIEVALSDNPVIKIADQEIMKKEYAKKGTYASLYPQIDATGAYQRTLQKQTMYMDAGQGAPTRISMGMNNTWSGGIGATMPIVSATLWKSLKISEMDVELAVEQSRASRLDMIEQVTKAFYSVLLSKDSYDVYKEAYDNAVANYNDVKKKYDVDKTSEYELLRAGVAVKNVEPDMYNAENSIVLTNWQLKALIGVDLTQKIECLGSLAEYEMEVVSNIVGTDSVSLTYNTNLKQLEIQKRQLDKALEMAKAANIPTLGLSLSYQVTSMNNTFNFGQYYWSPYSVAGLNLSIPIFAGGKRRNDIKQAGVNINQIQLQQEDTKRQLTVQSVQCVNSMNTCIKKYEAAQSNIGQAEKSYSIAVKRYEIGDGTQLEINDSRLALTQARLNLSQSIYEFMNAKATLEKLIGQNQ